MVYLISNGYRLVTPYLYTKKVAVNWDGMKVSQVSPLAELVKGQQLRLIRSYHHYSGFIEVSTITGEVCNRESNQ